MKELMAKYIVVSGGVLSGLGKGVIASSVGLILKDLGLKITSIKIDPYLNIDCGLLSPYEHGEVFVLSDGTEVDLDLGNYERFVGNDLTGDHNITTGKVYSKVISKERKGDYLGKTVQVIPHVTNEICDWIFELVRQDESDICVIELGGTVGDIESSVFVEALRQLKFKLGNGQFLNIHVSLVPEIGPNKEQKTKPTQSSVRTLRSLGIDPDIICCRSDHPIKKEVRDKISLFCFSDRKMNENVISSYKVENVLEVPLILLDQNIDRIILNKFGFRNIEVIRKKDQQLKGWKEMVSKMKAIETEKESLAIGIVGKYVENNDCYFSIYKALHHTSIHSNVKIEIVWIDAEEIEKGNLEKLQKSKGCIVAGGFGTRAIEGKILACEYCRKNNIPTLGICLGFQCAVIEFARNVLGFKDANSEEFDKESKNQVIRFLPEISKEKMGGNMRLGKKKSLLTDPKSQIFQLYGGKKEIFERHRHRYEVNTKYWGNFEEKGFCFVGVDEKKERLSVFELKNHPYYVGSQFHPEFLSKPMNPHPLFVGLVENAKKE